MRAITVPLFVFHIDVVLLSLFALYVVLTLPRALVRLFQPSEILNGFFLRSGSPHKPHDQPNQLHRADTHGRSGATRTRPMRSTSTRTNQTGHTLVGVPEDGEDAAAGPRSGKGKASGSVSRPSLIVPWRAAATSSSGARGGSSRRSAPPPRRSAPTRVPRWTTIIHPTLAYGLNFRVAPGFSFGKLLVLLIYAALMLYASLRDSNPFADPVRVGYVAMSQIPIAVALAGKTNWLSWASGVGYEKVGIGLPTYQVVICFCSDMSTLF